MTSAGPESAPRHTGPLQPVELAQAAVMAALCAAIAIIAVVVPFAAGLSLLGTVPMGLLAYRYRLRVLITATVAGGIIAFLIAGMGGFMTVLNCAYIGGLTGTVKRRGRGTPTVVASAVVAGALFGLAIVAALAVLSRLRHLIFESVTANITGLAAIIARIPNMEGAAERLTRDFATALDYWPVLFFAAGVVIVTFVSLVGWWALSKVLARLLGVPDVHKLEASSDTGVIAPVPLQLRDVRFRYPGTADDALGPVSLSVQPGEHLAVTGANGSGKTTLMLVLSGREPTAGTLHRPGAVGLGKIGGTAVVMQHPESQVLGTRVADDVVWGLPPGASTDVDRLLAEVGLDGFGERDTGGLSGGELQRLAVAAALAREPSLLIADEVTSMVDQDGREALMSVLSGLTRRHRTALVHITHYNAEAEAADRAVTLVGRAAADNIDAVHETEMVHQADVHAAAVAPETPRGGPVLELNGVGHEYGSGTPWAKTALRDIDFAVHEGDGVLIHGLNGSGKSTLAWIMAGLTVPTVGSCLLDGEPVSDRVGAVAISFQASRLQLMRSHVALEIASSAGFSIYDQAKVTEALDSVGLDPTLAARRIDQLSGGQMRRVVLAGLLARSPRALILDEPLAGLDAASARGLLRLLEDLRRRTRLTVVVISHDFAGLEDLCPRILHLEDGRLASAPTAAGGDVMTARKPRRQVVLLRPVPGTSVIHRLWAGTKLAIVAAIGVLLTFYPGWVPIGAVALLIALAAALAHIPRGVLPSVPRWLWILLLLGAVTAAFAGGSPVIGLGSTELGLGGLLNFLRVTALSIVLLGLGGMVSWTTNVAEVAPAVATLGRPLRALRVPVGDWAVALALALRAFPMLIDEFRVLYAARRLRPRDADTRRRSRRRSWAVEVIDLLAAAITVALRRADEMGDSITARGGAGQLSAAPSRPQRRDWLALAVVVAVCGTSLVLELTILGTSGTGR